MWAPQLSGVTTILLFFEANDKPLNVARFAWVPETKRTSAQVALEEALHDVGGEVLDLGHVFLSLIIPFLNVTLSVVFAFCVRAVEVM